MSRRRTETAAIRETRFRRTTVLERRGHTYQPSQQAFRCCFLITLVVSRGRNAFVTHSARNPATRAILLSLDARVERTRDLRLVYDQWVVFLLILRYHYVMR